MRKVVSSLFMTLDGTVEDPSEWSFDSFDGDMFEAMGKALAAIDAVLMGRVTYQEWAPYWPASVDEPYASFINGTTKYVASTTLENVDAWKNSVLTRDLGAEVERLKASAGGDIGVQGSPSVVRWLIAHGLLDELTLMVYPVLAGGRKRLFGDDRTMKRLRLVDSKTTGSGVALLTYEPLR